MALRCLMCAFCSLTLGLALRLVLANDILLDMTLAKAGKVLALLDLPCEHLSFTRLSFNSCWSKEAEKHDKQI